MVPCCGKVLCFSDLGFDLRLSGKGEAEAVLRLLSLVEQLQLPAGLSRNQLG